MNTRQLLFLVATLPGCTTIQLGAANLIETASVPRREIAYGDGPRQRYDLYPALDSARQPLEAAAPIVIFIHGGSWNSGDKRNYAWVGEALAQMGYVAVLPSYGLMPKTRFPEFVDDAARAVAHARTEAAKAGGDSTRIFLMGHSAGAHIAALLAYDARYLERYGYSPSQIRGFIGLSGPYDFVLDTRLLRATFAGSAEREHDAQPINFVSATVPRTLLVMGRDDRTVNPRNTRSLAAALRSKGANVDELWVGGTHGVSIGAFARINRGDSEIVRRIRAFIETP